MLNGAGVLDVAEIKRVGFLPSEQLLTAIHSFPQSLFIVLVVVLDLLSVEEVFKVLVVRYNFLDPSLFIDFLGYFMGMELLLTAVPAIEAWVVALLLFFF